MNPITLHEPRAEDADEFIAAMRNSQGLKLVLKKAFLELGLHRLEANIQPANLKSINLIKANGFSYEGISKFYLNIDGQWRDHERWALTLENYIEAVA